MRIADTTLGAKTEVASATEYMRIWKKYIDWLENERFYKAYTEMELKNDEAYAVAL